MDTKKYAVDTNILVFATNAESKHNAFCTDILLKGANGEIDLSMPDKVLYEMYAVLSNTIHKNSKEKAKKAYDFYLNCGYIKILRSTAQTPQIVSKLLTDHNVKGHYIHDIVMAAMLLENDVDYLYTDNVDDFTGIPALEVIPPVANKIA